MFKESSGSLIPNLISHDLQQIHMPLNSIPLGRTLDSYVWMCVWARAPMQVSVEAHQPIVPLIVADRKEQSTLYKTRKMNYEISFDKFLFIIRKYIYTIYMFIFYSESRKYLAKSIWPCNWNCIVSHGSNFFRLYVFWDITILQFLLAGPFILSRMYNNINQFNWLSLWLCHFLLNS